MYLKSICKYNQIHIKITILPTKDGDDGGISFQDSGGQWIDLVCLYLAILNKCITSLAERQAVATK